MADNCDGAPPAMSALNRHAEAYRPGRLLEVVRPVGVHGAPVVLLWHGSGPDERDGLVPLATAVAAYGTVALVPDWRSDDVVVGAEELLASIDFAVDAAAELGGDPGRVVLVGWSLGASAAADIALHPEIAGGWHPSGLVGLGGGYDRTPFGGIPPRDPMAGDSVNGAGRQALFVHGTSDSLISVDRSAVGAGVLAIAGWHAVLHQVGTDHAGVIGTVYDRTARRCVPSADSDRQAALAAVAREVAMIALALDVPDGDSPIQV